MKKVVIFGATGNIGAYFTDYCKSEFDDTDYEIIAVGRKQTKYYEENGIEYINVDIRHDDDFRKLPPNDVYAVVNLTGILPAYLKTFDPLIYSETNINGSIRIMEYARKSKADRVIYTQTWAEQAGYWGKSEVLSPDMPADLVYTGDHAFYSITKKAVTEMMRFYQEEYGIKSFVFRLPNVYMYHPQKKYYVDGEERWIGYRRMIDLASQGEDIEMWGDPTAFKDVLYIKDLCQMMYKAIICNKNGGVYNAGTGIKTTFSEQINGIIEVFSPKEKTSNVIACPNKPSFTSFVMDIENIKSDLGYEPEYSYKKYLEDYKKEQELKRFDPLWQS